MRNFALLLSYLFLSSQAFGGTITVANPSFEEPVTDRNGVSTVPGWTQSDVTPGGSGVWRPNSPGDFVSIPDGFQVGFVQTGFISQIVSDVLTANTRYTLDVEVGQDNQALLPDQYSVQLLAGGILLAEATSPAPPPQTFVSVSVVFDALPGNAQLGQNIEIRLVDKEPDRFISDPNFDDVRLSTIAIPEPSSLLLASLAGVVFCSRRRRA